MDNSCKTCKFNNGSGCKLFDGKLAHYSKKHDRCIRTYKKAAPILAEMFEV